MSMKQTEFEGKLRTMEETHRTSLNKLREDVTNQQRSTNQSVLTIDIGSMLFKQYFHKSCKILPADQSVRWFAKTYQILDLIGLYIA